MRICKGAAGGIGLDEVSVRTRQSTIEARHTIPEPLRPSHERLRSIREIIPIVDATGRKANLSGIPEILPWSKERRMRLKDPTGQKERLIPYWRPQGLDAIIRSPKINRFFLVRRPYPPVRIPGTIFRTLIELLRRHVLGCHHLEIVKGVFIVKTLRLVMEDFTRSPDRISCRPELLHDGPPFRQRLTPIAVIGVDPGG